VRHCDLNAALDVQQEARLYTAAMLDLGDYGLLETIQHWRKKLTGDEFVVVHEESKFLRKQR
jgi:hypothetical protein